MRVGVFVGVKLETSTLRSCVSCISSAGVHINQRGLLLLSENHSAPPDVTSYTNNTSSSTTSEGIHVERTPGAGTAPQKQTPKYGNAELMETGDGEWRLAGPEVAIATCLAIALLPDTAVVELK